MLWKPNSHRPLHARQNWQRPMSLSALNTHKPTPSLFLYTRRNRNLTVEEALKSEVKA